MTLGVLDWGIGGLFALRHARARVPGLDALYLADSGSRPYGTLSHRELARSVSVALHRLAALGATEILVACHSASTSLRDATAPVPVHGVIDPRSVPTSGGRTLVLGGARTIRSGVWRRALEGHGVERDRIDERRVDERSVDRRGVDERRVVGRIAQPLSAHVEAGRTGSDVCRRDLARILRPVLDADVVILACTHYAALRDQVQERMPRATVVDPALGVVDRLRLASGSGKLRVLTSGDPAAMRRAARLATGMRLEEIERIALD